MAKIKFPPNPADETLFEAAPGVFYKFNNKQLAWIRVKNIDAEFVVATYLHDGLMSKDDFTKLTGLLLPPPHTTLGSEDCVFKFNDGTFGFRSSAEHLFINHELSLIDRDEKGFTFERREVWQIHENTYGIDFKINLEKLISELESRGKLTYRQSIGPQGHKGPKGVNGIDELDTGPKGQTGIDGVNQPFPGSLSIEPSDYETELSNRGIVDIRTQSNSPDENFLIITRANLGDPDFCPRFIKPSNVKSKWMLVIDERPAVKQVIRECETDVCGVRSCGPDIRTLPIVQTFCTTRLYYLDMFPIEETIKQRYLMLLDELKTTKETVVVEWLKRMVEVYNEQKLALCCALENCQSRRENTRHRHRIEDIRVHAARDGLSITIDGEDARETVETNPGLECPGEETAVVETGTGTSIPTDGTREPEKVCVVLQCSVHGPNLDQALVIPAIRSGTYTIEILTSGIIGCCYSFSETNNPSKELALSENVWNDIKDDITKVAEGLHTAFRNNTPYIGLIQVVYQTPTGQVVKTLTNDKHFRTRGEAQSEFWGKKLVFDHSGGDIKLFVPQKSGLVPSVAQASLTPEQLATRISQLRLQLLRPAGLTPSQVTALAIQLRSLLDQQTALTATVPPPPSANPKFGFEGGLELCLTRTPDPEPPPVEACEEGFTTNININTVKNSISATAIPVDATIALIGQPTLPTRSTKPQDPFVAQKFYIIKSDSLEIVKVLTTESTIIELGAGEYEIETLSGVIYDSPIVGASVTGTNLIPHAVLDPSANISLIITEDMYLAAKQSIEALVSAWKRSADNQDIIPFITATPALTNILSNPQFIGFINDYNALKNTTIDFDVNVYKTIINTFKPYRASAGVAYPDLNSKTVIGFVGDQKLFYSSKEEATAALVGQKLTIKTSGGKVAFFFDDNDKRIGPSLNTGSLQLRANCLTVKCSDEDQIVATLPCGGGLVKLTVEPGEYVAELIGCCCTNSNRDAATAVGQFDIIYIPADAGPTTVSGPLGTVVGSNPETGVSAAGQTSFFRLRSSKAIITDDRSLSFFGPTLQFNTIDGNLFLKAANDTFNKVGELKVKLTPRECFDREAVLEAPEVGTNDDIISDLICDMHFQHIKQYEFAWKVGNCCGFLLELDGIKWIVVKRSIGTDIACGGGERSDANCIKEGKALNTHPAIAFPTVNGRDFLGVPSSGFRRMFRDEQLEADLLTKLRSGQFTTLKLIEQVSQGSTTTPRPSIINGPILDQERLAIINDDILFKFETIVFPFES